MHLHGTEVAIIVVITTVGIRAGIMVLHVVGIMATKQVGMEEECRQDGLKRDTGKKEILSFLRRQEPSPDDRCGLSIFGSRIFVRLRPG